MISKLFSAIAFLFTLNAHAQFTNVMIDNIGDPEEPSICINPKNTNQLVAGSNIDNQYYSADGGLTWNKQTLSSTWGVWGDPCVVVDSSGRFYYFHLSNTGGPNGWIDRIVCQRSDDGGVTFPIESFTGLNAAKDQDKEWAVYDKSPASAFRGTMYVTWTEFDEYANPNPVFRSRIMFSKSSDHGVTWSAPFAISQFTGDCIDEDNTAEGAVPAVGPNGEVYVTWSLDNTLYFDRSLDGGITWLATDIIAATQPGGWDYTIAGHDRANGLPIAVCDLSGGINNGTLYVNWSDQRNGATDTDVFIAKSTDGGNTWNAPVRVNNDAAGKQNYLCWLTIDQATGMLYVVFYDRRAYSNNQTDVYLAYSSDGGATFTNTKISITPFTPTANQFFGDYTNITAHNGKVRPIWARMDSGASSVWTAIIDFPTGIQSQNFIQLQTNISNYPNPFHNKTTLSITALDNKNLSLTMHDVSGRMVRQIFSNKFFASGNHQILFDNSLHKLHAGVYYLKLTDGATTANHKILIVE